MVQKPPDAFRLTMRRLMLVPVIYFSSLLAFLFSWANSPGAVGSRRLPLLLLLLLPWMIGVLISVARRADPIRNWAVPLLMSLFFPALILSYDVAMYSMLSRVENMRSMALVIICNIAFLVWYSRILARL